METFELANENKDFRLTEAYKALRTNITFCGSDVKVIALTSCMPNDGKSTVAWNVAVSMAETGKKVLLIDADLRNSVIMRRFKIGQKIVGLSHYLSDQATLQEVLYHSSLPNLDIILSGSFPPNPAELLSTPKFESMIKELREQYDYIIIDTPPLGSVIDAAIIATVCDGSILVISSGKVSYKFARDTKAQLEKSGSKILGVVLNNVEYDSALSHYSKSYYYHYGYGPKNAK